MVLAIFAFQHWLKKWQIILLAIPVKVMIFIHISFYIFAYGL